MSKLEGKDLEDFIAIVDEIEGATKLDFFTKFTPEESFNESKTGSYDFWFGDQ